MSYVQPCVSRSSNKKNKNSKGVQSLNVQFCTSCSIGTHNTTTNYVEPVCATTVVNTNVNKQVCTSCSIVGSNTHTSPTVRGSVSTTDTNSVNSLNITSCNICGRAGHNARTCPTLSVSKQFCRRCKAQGHNARTCPTGTVSVSVSCSYCSIVGHNARTCPTRFPNSNNNISTSLNSPNNKDAAKFQVRTFYTLIRLVSYYAYKQQILFRVV